MARISSDTAEVIISGVDNTTAATSAARRNLQGVEAAANAVNQTLMRATAIIAGMAGAWNLADRAAGFMEQEAALNRLAAAYGSSSKIMVDSIKQAADGTISSLDAVNIATQGLAKGLTPEQIANLTQVAKAYGDITNQNTAQALNEIATAAETGRSRMLQQAGIIVDLNKAWDEYAKSTGRTVDQLSRAEKQQVSVNAIMKASSDVMTRTASSGMSAADAMDKFKATLSDIGIIAGKVVISITTMVFGITQVISQIINGVLATISGLIETVAKGINDFVQKLPAPQWVKDATAATAAGTGEITKYFEESTNIASDNFKQSIAMFKGYWAELSTLSKTNPIVFDDTEGTQKVVTAQKVKDDALLRSMQLRDQYSKKVYDNFVQEYQMTQNIGSAIVASTKKMVADVIKIMGEEESMKAGRDIWDGFTLSANPLTAYLAPGKFASGAGHAALAATMGVASSAVSGAGGGAGGGGGAPSGGATFSNSSLQPTQQEQQKITTIFLPNDEVVSRKYILNVLWPTVAEAHRNGELVNLNTAGAPIYA